MYFYIHFLCSIYCFFFLDVGPGAIPPPPLPAYFSEDT